MDALLILSGLIFLLGGWCGLVASSARLPLPLLLLAGFLPILTLLMPRRGYALLPRLLLGLGLLLLATGIATLYQLDRDRFDLLLSGDWIRSANDQALAGRVAGQRFVPDRVQWRNNELLFEEGPPERVRRSLAVRFDSAQALLVDTVIQKVPGEEGPWPELVLQWHEGAMESPGLRTLSGPYSLSLRFTPSSNGRVPLFINLTLPAEQETFLRGEAELRTPPPWLAALQVSRSKPEPIAQTVPPARPQGRPAEPQWGELSILALIDEPDAFIGSTLRLTMLSGRVHEGRLAGVTDDRRIVLGQQRGANTLDFQFNPVDIARVERLSTR